MIPKKEAVKLLENTVSKHKEEIPVILQISKMVTISQISMFKVTNRISIKKYHDKYAAKRTFYKAISIQYPTNEE